MSHVKDLNFLYYTEEGKKCNENSNIFLNYCILVITTLFENVVGKCYLAFGDNLESTSEWSKKGPFRFYFTESYNPKTHKSDEVSMQARRIGTLGKGKGMYYVHYNFIMYFLSHIFVL